jgi:hypothetical protein
MEKEAGLLLPVHGEIYAEYSVVKSNKIESYPIPIQHSIGQKVVLCTVCLILYISGISIYF